MKRLKRQLQNVFRRLGIYERLKASCFYDFYWKIADSRMLVQRNREVEFYRSLLNDFRKGDLIFDIGANLGHKVDIFLRLGARVVAVDPDEFNQGILRRKFLDWRISPKPVTIVGKAVSDKSGTETFWVDEPGSGKNTLNRKWVDTLKQDSERFGKALTFAASREVVTTTLDELIAAHGQPAFIKIDVEGHEPSVVRGLKQPVPLLSFEVNLPEFKEEGLQCIESLGRLCPEGRFNFIADSEPNLGLGAWLDSIKFIPVFEQCKHESVEVFWKTPFESTV